MPSQNLDGKTVFVTGGTGTIGERVVRELLREGAKVIVYSRDQNKQFVLNYGISSSRVTFVNGDICDQDILFRAIKGADLAVHCAASKHVPLCEHNADSAIKINTEGTRNVLLACLKRDVKKFLLLSTDKAVNPTCVMGATKFLAERLTLEFNKHFPCSVVRLGNVFASNGSVVPTYADRIKNKLPLIVNNPVATRYFIKKNDASRFIVERLKDMNGGEIFIKKMKVMTILSLAEAMKPTVEYPIEIGALTQGEKIKETLVTQEESSRAEDQGDFISVGDKRSESIVNMGVEFFTNDEIKEMLRGL